MGAASRTVWPAHVANMLRAIRAILTSVRAGSWVVVLLANHLSTNHLRHSHDLVPDSCLRARLPGTSAAMIFHFAHLAHAFAVGAASAVGAGVAGCTAGVADAFVAAVAGKLN